MLLYRKLHAEELSRDLFQGFIRRQTVTMCWRKIQNEWTVQEDPFTDDWTESDYRTLVSCLQNTLETGGFVYAAFQDSALKGFVSVESAFLDDDHTYLDLSNLHVSEDMRRQGIGATLFEAAKGWALEKGASRLYISAHSAVESQAFYKKMGCVEAAVYQSSHVEAEPFDCQLECPL